MLIASLAISLLLEASREIKTGYEESPVHYETASTDSLSTWGSEQVSLVPRSWTLDEREGATLPSTSGAMYSAVLAQSIVNHSAETRHRNPKAVVWSARSKRDDLIDTSCRGDVPSSNLYGTGLSWDFQRGSGYIGYKVLITTIGRRWTGYAIG